MSTGTNTSAFEAKAKSVSFDTDYMWVDLTDGRRLAVPLSFLPRLRAASDEQRQQCVISGGGVGLHWEALDEDISVPHLLSGLPSVEAA